MENSTLSPQAKNIQSNNTGLPLVSVVIPTYNRKQYIQEAINSALAQTYPAVEIIVVDDGSTDGTGEILQAVYSDDIKYIYQPNQGASAARNKAIRHGYGQYIALLDSDDLWMPTKLEKQVALMECRPEFGLVSCHSLQIDSQGKLTKTSPLHSHQTTDTISLEVLILNSPVNASTIMIRRACLDEVGWFPEEIRYGEDRDLILRIAAKYKVGFVDEILNSLRGDAGNQVTVIRTKREAERRLADRLLVNERVFPLFQGDVPTLATLKARALAREYARGAISISIYGEYERGASLLYQAVDLDPATWQDGKQVAELSLRHAVVLSKEQTLAAAVRFVEEVYAHLPAPLYSWNTRFRRQILGELQVEFAFWQYQRGKSSSVPRHALRGVLYDPAWLRNRGLWSIAMRALTKMLAVQTGSESPQPMRTRKQKDRIFE